MKSKRHVSYDDALGVALTDPHEAAAYLSAVIELKDQPTLLLAMREVWKARGMTDRTLLKALSSCRNNVGITPEQFEKSKIFTK